MAVEIKQQSIFLKDGEKEEERLIRPIKYQDIYNMYELQRSAFWNAGETEIPLPIKDLNEFQTLSKELQHFVKMILAFFAKSDMIVNENLAAGFIDRARCPELKTLYRFQAMMEDVHSDMYARLLVFYVPDEKEREKYVNAIVEIPSIKAKADWCRRWIEKGNIIERLVAFAIVEGVAFSGSFGGIFYFKKKGLLNSLATSNELIFRDENSHVKTNLLVYRKYIPEREKLQDKKIIEMMREAVAYEEDFMREALPKGVIGLNSTLMCNYIKHTADKLLVQLIGEKIYNIDENNLPAFVTLQGVSLKANFFEVTPTNYAKGNKKESTTLTSTEITFDEDF